MVQGHVRVGLGDLGHHLAPQDGGGEHVGLVDGGDPGLAHPGRFKRYLGDALDLEAVVHLGVEGLLGGAFPFTPLGLAEIDAAGQLAYAGDVEAAIGDVGTQRGELLQTGVDAGRAQVAEQFEVGTQGQQGTALRLIVGRQVLPLGATHRSEQHRIGRFAAFDRALGQRCAVVVDGDAADVVTVIVEGEAEFGLHLFQYLDGLCHHFRANAVTRQYCDPITAHTLSVLIV